MLTKFALKTNVQEKFQKVEKEIWEELALKMEKKVFDRKFEHFEQEADTNNKRINKEIGSVREVADRMRRKTEETSNLLKEIKMETDLKLSAKEG